MIRLLDSLEGVNLKEGHISRVIRSHFAAYGSGYDFCRFYEICGRKRIGVISVFNGGAAVGLCEGAAPALGAKREIAEFIGFCSPEFVEISPELALNRGFSGYSPIERSFFEVPPGDSAEGLIYPEPAVAFETAFGENDSFALWLTDTLRRQNLGLSRLLGYESSVLTVRFIDGGAAYIADVATPFEDRGKGYARTLLAKASRLLAEEGASAYLSANEETAGFYESLGYKKIFCDRAFKIKEKL